MEELKFDNETATGLYRIFCGLGRSCYENAEVYDEAKPVMKKAYDKVLEWGRTNNCDPRGKANLIDIDTYIKENHWVFTKEAQLAIDGKLIAEGWTNYTYDGPTRRLLYFKEVDGCFFVKCPQFNTIGYSSKELDAALMNHSQDLTAFFDINLRLNTITEALTNFGWTKHKI